MEKSLPVKLKGWNEPDTGFVVVHDQDANNCKEIKQKLNNMCYGCNKQVLIRIACRELESWYFGDLPAVSKAVGYDLSDLEKKAKYRIPDLIENPKQQLHHKLQLHNIRIGQIEAARKIAHFMNIL